jgi:hypothetical protein
MGESMSPGSRDESDLADRRRMSVVTLALRRWSIILSYRAFRHLRWALVQRLRIRERVKSTLTD